MQNDGCGWDTYRHRLLAVVGGILPMVLKKEIMLRAHFVVWWPISM